MRKRKQKRKRERTPQETETFLIFANTQVSRNGWLLLLLAGIAYFRKGKVTR